MADLQLQVHLQFAVFQRHRQVALHRQAPFHVGGQFYTIAGTTEPGATVFINNEEVDVESNGSFQKLIALDKLGPNG